MLQINEENIKDYQQNGFVISENKLSENLFNKISNSYDEFISTNKDLTLEEMASPHLIGGTNKKHKVNEELSRSFLDIGTDSEIVEQIKKFLGAKDDKEIIFTSGSTEGINLVAYSWALYNLKKGDEILLSIAEHHSNIVPWHFIREKIGVKLKWIEPREDGSINADDVIDSIGTDTKLITITHMSNVLGSVVDVKKICKIARNKQIVTLIDGSQSIVHMPINVSELCCDFFVFTGHKLYGPSASGAIYINQNRFDEMEPFLGGGSMINSVGTENITYNKAPHKFEAGTPAIIPIIGLGAAIDFVLSIGQKNILEYENMLTNYAKDRLYNLDFLKLEETYHAKAGI